VARTCERRLAKLMDNDSFTPSRAWSSRLKKDYRQEHDALVAHVAAMLAAYNAAYAEMPVEDRATIDEAHGDAVAAASAAIA
jgi:hypothetical protein